MNRDLYNQIVKEHFDINDRTTLRVMVSINEADQNQVLGTLAARLYDSIVKKVADIDFGQIPNAKGDITKIPNYMDLMECLTIMRDMMVEKKQSTKPADIIFNAIENLKTTRQIWEKGFNIDCEMVMVFFNTIALSIVSSISLLIASSVEFIKNPETEIIEVQFDKVAAIKSKDGLLFKNLDNFNKSVKKGDIQKTFDAVLKAQRTVKESTVVSEVVEILFVGAIVIGLLTCIIPILHQTTAMLFWLRQSVAFYLAGEADLIMLNAEKVNYNRTKTAAEKKKIIARQHKIANTFRAWSNKLMITANKAEKQAEKTIAEERQTKAKIDDVVEDMPDSASIF